MPGRHDYLSDYPDHYLTARCVICRRNANYDVVDIATKIGNCQIVGLKTTIGKIWGCRKLFNLNHDQCRLDVRIGGSLIPKRDITMSEAELLLNKMGAYKASEHTRLGSLSSWQHLYAACKCGHIGRLDHDKLRERHGADKMLVSLTSKMNCKRGDGHRVLFFAIKQDER